MAEAVVDIEAILEKLPSYALYVDTYTELKYKHLDDVILEYAASMQGFEVDAHALSATFQMQIDDIISQVTNWVLEANSITREYVTEFENVRNPIRERWGAIVAMNSERVSKANDVTQECAAELAALSCSIIERLTSEVSLLKRQVSRAESITQSYVDQVRNLSSSITGLDRAIALVSESQQENARIDHAFCTIVFKPEKQWRHQLKTTALEIEDWKKEIDASTRTLLAPLIEISGLYIGSLQKTVHRDFIQPRKLARMRIDRILAPFEQTRTGYAVMQQKFSRMYEGSSQIMSLCNEFEHIKELSLEDRLPFVKFPKICMEINAYVGATSHAYRAAWRDRQVAALGFNQMSKWTVKSLTANNNPLFGKTISSIFGGSDSIAKENHRRMRAKLRKHYPVCDPHHRLPTSDPHLDIYWRQLDVIAPIDLVEIMAWRIHGEAQYLRHSLRGECGTLWTWLSPHKRSVFSRALVTWFTQFATYRNDFRADFFEFKILNWLRLTMERDLRAESSSAYLVGKFEVRNPLSQSPERFDQWVDLMVREMEGAYIAHSARKLTPTEWNYLQRRYRPPRISRPVTSDLGSSVERPSRRKTIIGPSRRSLAPRKSASLARPRNIKPRSPSLKSRRSPVLNALARPWILPLTPEQFDADHSRDYSTYANSRVVDSQCTDHESRQTMPMQSVEDETTPVTSTETQYPAERTPTVEQPQDETDASPSANDPTAPIYWSHSSQQSPAGNKIIVHYCRTLRSTEEIVQLFLSSKVIGFDMEWKSSASSWDSKQNNVSVIQLANEERIAIFQVALFRPGRTLNDLVSPSLKRLIESPDVTKVGVAIKADCTRLRKYLGIDAKATFELSHLFKLIKFGKDNPKLVNKRGVNLSDQVQEHFGLPLDKSEDVRCGDWTRVLNYQQVQCE